MLRRPLRFSVDKRRDRGRGGASRIEAWQIADDAGAVGGYHVLCITNGLSATYWCAQLTFKTGQVWVALTVAASRPPLVRSVLGGASWHTRTCRGGDTYRRVLSNGEIRKSAVGRAVANDLRVHHRAVLQVWQIRLEKGASRVRTCQNATFAVASSPPQCSRCRWLRRRGMHRNHHAAAASLAQCCSRVFEGYVFGRRCICQHQGQYSPAVL
jgi:hypothetical protein